jgi:hypothetical protein
MGRVVVTVDHRFALSNPALVSARSKKSFSSVSCPILACSGCQVTGSTAAPPPKASGRVLQQLPLPLGDLVGVDLEVLGKLGQRLVLTQGR